MNYSVIRYVLGSVLKFEGLFLCLPLLVGLVAREESSLAFFFTILICLSLGFLLSFRKPKNMKFYAVEGFVSVSLSWIVLSLAGCLPFFLSGEIPSFVDALFETVSGFTTTGASILSEVEPMSRCCLLWRSFTHWIGGMGVLVFVLAVLPSGEGNMMYLMKAESPGPSVEKLVPKVRTTAFILYAVYTALTVSEMLLLFLTGMPLFDAVNIGFATAGTGGFGVLNDSCGSYAPHLQVIITVFMILFGVNFNCYFLLLRGKLKSALCSEEVRVYLGIILAAGLLVAWNTREMFSTLGETLRHAFFQVASIITTTGFSSVDFGLWPQFSLTILVLLCFIGACAGSTGGGIKVSRIIIMFKTVLKELFTIKHPRGVRSVKLDGRTVEHETVRSVNIFLVIYVLVMFGSVLLVSLDNFDFTTNFTAVVATINNIGPGLEKVGPASNFGHFSDVSKVVLIFDMLAGRLELFPMIVLFSPLTWKKRK